MTSTGVVFTLLKITINCPNNLLLYVILKTPHAVWLIYSALRIAMGLALKTSKWCLFV